MVALLVATTSCDMDNYDAPDAGLYGTFIDTETGEPVQQDIYKGTEIEYIESGYTTIERMIVKTDGTYCNSIMFANEYEITPVRGNFEPLDPQKIKVKGQTQLDFHVKPYVRIKNAVIFKNGDKVRASFKVQQTGYDKLASIALFVHPEPSVGANMNIIRVIIPVGERLNEEKTYSITLDIPSQKNPALTAGKSFFFRVGAIVDVPEAKYNYAQAIQLTM